MKKVLFIPCYDGHIRIFHPVIKEMEKRGDMKPLVICLEQFHGHQLKEYLQEKGLPHINFDLTSCPGPIPGSFLAGRIKNAWRYYHFLHSAQQQIAELFNEQQPAFVVTATDGFRNDVYFLYEAYKRKIPSLCLYGSITSPALAEEVGSVSRVSLLNMMFRLILLLAGLPMRHTPVTSRGYADMISIWGEQHRQVLLARGADPAKLIITGSPAHDLIYDKLDQTTGNSSLDLRRSLGIDEIKKLFLFTTQPVAKDGLCDSHAQQQMTERLIETCARFEDHALIIKLHPRELLTEYEYLKRHPLGKDVPVFSEDTADLYDLINIADVMITQSSTTAMDGMLFGKEVVIIDVLTRVKDAMGYVASGASPGINNLDELFDILYGLLNDKKTRQQFKRKREEFISSYIYRFDGRSSERVLELIDKMISGSKQ